MAVPQDSPDGSRGSSSDLTEGEAKQSSTQPAQIEDGLTASQDSQRKHPQAIEDVLKIIENHVIASDPSIPQSRKAFVPASMNDMAQIVKTALDVFAAIYQGRDRPPNWSGIMTTLGARQTDQANALAQTLAWHSNEAMGAQYNDKEFSSNAKQNKKTVLDAIDNGSILVIEDYHPVRTRDNDPAALGMSSSSLSNTKGKPRPAVPIYCDTDKSFKAAFFESGEGQGPPKDILHKFVQVCDLEHGQTAQNFDFTTSTIYTIGSGNIPGSYISIEPRTIDMGSKVRLGRGKVDEESRLVLLEHVRQQSQMDESLMNRQTRAMVQDRVKESFDREMKARNRRDLPTRLQEYEKDKAELAVRRAELKAEVGEVEWEEYEKARATMSQKFEPLSHDERTQIPSQIQASSDRPTTIIQPENNSTGVVVNINAYNHESVRRLSTPDSREPPSNRRSGEFRGRDQYPVRQYDYERDNEYVENLRYESFRRSDSRDADRVRGRARSSKRYNSVKKYPQDGRYARDGNHKFNQPYYSGSMPPNGWEDHHLRGDDMDHDELDEGIALHYESGPRVQRANSFATPYQQAPLRPRNSFDRGGPSNRASDFYPSNARQDFEENGFGRFDNQTRTNNAPDFYPRQTSTATGTANAPRSYGYQAAMYSGSNDKSYRESHGTKRTRRDQLFSEDGYAGIKRSRYH